jgi:hypothetical protein
MAEVTVHLAPGTFYAGIDRPWYVSQEVVAQTLRQRFGVTQVRFHPKSAPLPAGVSPDNDPKYSGPWSEWISASYAGPERSIRQDKSWSWLDFVPAPPATIEPTDGSPAVPGGAPAMPAPSPSGETAAPPAAPKKAPPRPAGATGAGEGSTGLGFALGTLAGLAALLWVVRR